MKVVNLGENPSVLNNFIAEMRDATIQKDRLRFSAKSLPMNSPRN